MTSLTIDLPDALAERLQRTFHPDEPATLMLRLLEEAIEREEAIHDMDNEARQQTTRLSTHGGQQQAHRSYLLQGGEAGGADSQTGTATAMPAAAAIDEAFGLWQRHGQLIDGLEYQQRLRAEWPE